MSSAIFRLCADGGLSATSIEKSRMMPYGTEDGHNDVRLNGQEYAFIIDRVSVGDVLKSVHFRIKAAALPPGWVYKNQWVDRAFKSLTLESRSIPFIQTTQTQLRMRRLIWPLPDKNMSFDFTLEERRAKSLAPHETIYEFEAIREATIISNYLGMSRLIVTLNSVYDCIEADPGFCPTPPIPADYNPIIEFDPYYTQLIVNNSALPCLTDEYRSKNLNKKNRDSVVYQSCDTTLVLAPQETFSINQRGHCTVVYMYVTAADGGEIPYQAINSIRVNAHGVNLYELSGFQARHMTRQLLPHASVSNDRSHNMYYLPYCSQFADIDDGFLNLNIITNYRVIIKCAESIINTEVKITFMHRIHKSLDSTWEGIATLTGVGVEPIAAGDGVEPTMTITGDGVEPSAAIAGDGVEPSAAITGDGVEPGVRAAVPW